MNESTKKLSEDKSLIYLLMSRVTKQPFFTKTGVSFLYDNIEDIEKEKKVLIEEGDEVYSISYSGDRKGLFENLRDSGVSFVCLNGNPEYVHMSELVELVEYDGFWGLDKPLLNSKLNRSLNIFYQDLAKDQADFMDAQLLFARMKDSYYLAPVNIPESAGTELDPTNIIFPVLKDMYGNDCIPVFTDWRMLSDFLTQKKADVSRLGGYILNVDTMLAAIKNQPGLLFVLNPNSISMRLTAQKLEKLKETIDEKNFIDEVRRLGSDYYAKKESDPKNDLSEASEDDDPVPEFLKEFLER